MTRPPGDLPGNQHEQPCEQAAERRIGERFCKEDAALRRDRGDAAENDRHARTDVAVPQLAATCRPGPSG